MLAAGWDSTKENRTLVAKPVPQTLLRGVILINSRASVFSVRAVVEVATSLGYSVYVLAILGIWRFLDLNVLQIHGCPTRIDVVLDKYGTGRCAGRSKPSKLISHRISIHDAPEAYEKFDQHAKRYTKVVIHFAEKGQRAA